MTPPVLSLLWRISVLKWVFFIYVLWANKCQEKILKILPLPSQEPFVFTVSCWLRDEESLLVWLLEVNLSMCRKRAPLLPSNE